MKKCLMVVSLLALGGCGGTSGLGSGELPPSNVMESCLRLMFPGGVIRDSKSGTPSVKALVQSLAAVPDAQLTWERYGERSYILHDVVPDRVTGGEQRIDLQFYPTPEDGESGASCGPGQVVVTRAVVNGIEARGVEVPDVAARLIASMKIAQD